MKKFSCKDLLIIGGMVIASLILANDFIQIMKGASYTWFGLATGILNIMIVGLGLDVIRG